VEIGRRTYGRETKSRNVLVRGLRWV
jgi:hypothetical protein